MSLIGNRLEENQAFAAESDAGLGIMDEWLRLEDEHTNPGFLLPSRDTVVAWCENHPGTIVLTGNALLWGPIVWAMWKG